VAVVVVSAGGSVVSVNPDSVVVTSAATEVVVSSDPSPDEQAFSSKPMIRAKRVSLRMS
jgi:hypothetical protein